MFRNAGNQGWVDDSGDGIQEPLLDLGDTFFEEKVAVIFIGTFFQMVLMMAEDVRRVPLAQIEEQIVIATPGETLAYVTDIRRSPENDRRVLELAAGLGILHALRAATALVADGILDAAPVMLEPIYILEVTVPDEHLGDIVGVEGCSRCLQAQDCWDR